MTIDETQLSDDPIRGHQLLPSNQILANHFAKAHPGIAPTRLRNLIDAWTNRVFLYPDNTDVWVERDVFPVVLGLAKNEEFLELCLFATAHSDFLSIEHEVFILGERVMECIELGMPRMSDKSSCEISRDLFAMLQKTVRPLLEPEKQH